jgi:hypothetical protein
MMWLAHTYSPEKLIDWVRGRRAAAPTTRATSGRSTAARWRRLGCVDRVGESLPAEEPRGDPPVSDHAVPRCLAARPRVGLARALRREGGQAVRGLQLSGGRRARRGDRRGDRGARAPRRHQRAGHLHRHLPGLRSGVAAAVLHDRQRRAPGSGAPGSAHPQNRTPDEGRADRRPGVQPGRPDAVGHPSSQRHRVARPDRAALSRVDARAHLAVRHGRLRPGRIGRRDAPFRVVWRDQRAAGRPRVRHGAPARRRGHARGPLRLRTVGPLGLRLHP